MKGIFYGLGVGPGDPELLTLKALRIIKEMDWIAVPVSAKDRESVALTIVGRFLSPSSHILRLEFPMIRESLQLEQAWEGAYLQVRNRLERGETVAFLTLGDPMLYSTCIYLDRKLRAQGYPVFIVPGITSFCAAAASAGVPLATGNEKVAFLPGTISETALRQELGRYETIVIFKVAGSYGTIVSALEKEGRLQGSVLVIACGFPEEKIITDLYSMVGKKLPYFSMVIVGRRLAC
jgi:precorrin-2/cobalt-factor-2 C20-methyltransferase